MSAPPAGPRARHLAMRQEAVDQLDHAWNHALNTNGTDGAIPFNLAVAGVSALLYIGDQVKAASEFLGVIADRMGGER